MHENEILKKVNMLINEIHTIIINNNQFFKKKIETQEKKIIENNEEISKLKEEFENYKIEIDILKNYIEEKTNIQGDSK